MLLVAPLFGCARKTDERVRGAWGSSKAPGAEVGSGGPSTREVDEDDGLPAPVLRGWERLEQLVDAALVEARLGIDEDVLARLAGQWCRVEPQPLGEGRQRRRICVPDPPLLLGGNGFDLEMGNEGVIGLVAHDLSDADSAALADQALVRTERWCTEQTTVTPPSTAPDASPAASFRTCVVEGSAMLSVGRFPSKDGSLWTVTVAVIDAS